MYNCPPVAFALPQEWEIILAAMSAGNTVTGQKTVQSVGTVATVRVQGVAVVGPPHVVPQYMAGEAMGWELTIWVVLHIVGLVMQVGCHLRLVGSLPTALSQGTGTPEQQALLLRGHQFMIVNVFIAALTITRNIELALTAQVILRIVT